MSNDKKRFGISIFSMEDAVKKFPNAIICIAEDRIVDIKKSALFSGMKNIHRIMFNQECERWGTEYGGVYVPKNFTDGKLFIVYSFGIGEDLSFSETVIKNGGECFAFDPTPKAVKYVENHKLFSNPKFHFFPFGISDKDGEEDFFLPKRADFVSASVVKHKNVDCEHSIKVKMKTLRTIMQELGHGEIDILKMDIEGAEFKVMNDVMNPDLDEIKLGLLCVEIHERFFDTRNNIDNFYYILQKKGFYDLYGTDKEPTFIML